MQIHIFNIIFKSCYIQCMKHLIFFVNLKLVLYSKLKVPLFAYAEVIYLLIRKKVSNSRIVTIYIIYNIKILHVICKLLTDNVSQSPSQQGLMVYISLHVSGLWSQVTVLNGVSNYGLDDVSCRSKQIDSLQLL